MTDEKTTPCARDCVTHAEATRAHLLILLGIGILIVIFGVGTAIGFKMVDDSADDIRALQAKALASNIASCEAGKSHRAYEIVLAGQTDQDEGITEEQARKRQAAVIKLLPLRDCAATAEAGQVVPLSPTAFRDYVNEVARIAGIKDWDRQG